VGVEIQPEEYVSEDGKDDDEFDVLVHCVPMRMGAGFVEPYEWFLGYGRFFVSGYTCGE